MSKMKFSLNRSGVAALMKSSEMQAVLKEKASAVRERCGDGYEQDLQVGKTRANASVWTKTRKAVKDNHTNNTLLKAVR